MTLDFEAAFVECASAMGGEILQVSFDTVPSTQEEDRRTTPYVLISRNFEFPDSPTVEWHDGVDDDGGAEILAATLSRNRLSMTVAPDSEIEVSFSLPDKRFMKLRSFLRRILEDHVALSD
jgi:hypothetical protein